MPVDVERLHEDGEVEKIQQFTTKHRNIIIAVVIAVIIATIAVMYFMPGVKSDVYETYLYGFWVADDSFCEESDISSMLLFVGDPSNPKSSKVHRDAYIIINNDIANQMLTIDYTKPKVGKNLQTYKFPAKFTFTDEDIDIPSDLTVEVNVVTGRLRLYSADTIYGAFYKDHEITERLRE